MGDRVCVICGVSLLPTWQRDTCGLCIKRDVEEGRPPIDEHELRWRLTQWGWPEHPETRWVIDHAERFTGTTIAKRWKDFRVELFLARAVFDDGSMMLYPDRADSSLLPYETRPHDWAVIRVRAWKVGVSGFLEEVRDREGARVRWSLRDAEPDVSSRDLRLYSTLLAIEQLRRAIQGIREKKDTPGYIPNLGELQKALEMGNNPKSFYDWRNQRGVTDAIIDRLTGRI